MGKWKYNKKEETYSAEFTIPLGKVYLYVEKQTNGKWKYSAYWWDKETCCDNTIVIASKKDWCDDPEDAKCWACRYTEDEFENDPIIAKLQNSASKVMEYLP